MTSLNTQWLRFQNWLKSLLQTTRAPSQAAKFDLVEYDMQFEENLIHDLRVSRHTIRVNLGLLEEEITELNEIAQKAPPSAAVSAAKTLLEKAQGALLLDMALFALSAASTEQLGEILGQVFEAMNQSNTARHLLNACR